MITRKKEKFISKINQSKSNLKNRDFGRSPGRIGRNKRKSASKLGLFFNWFFSKFNGFFKSLMKAIATVFVAVIALGTVSALAFGVYIFFSEGDYFAVKKVNILGLNKIDRDTIIKTANLDKPINILSFDAEKAEQAIKTIPWVDSVSVSKTLPDFIEINLKERNAKLLASIGHIYYIDEKGYPFKPISAGESPNFAILTGFSENDLKNPTKIIAEAIAETYILYDVLAKRDDEFSINNISEIHYDQAAGFTLYTRTDVIKIKVGFGNYEQKFNRLEQVAQYLKQKNIYDGISYFNLDADPRVTVRYKDHKPREGRYLEKA